MTPSRRLKDLGQIITGNTPSMSDLKNYESDDICFIKPSDINEDDITAIENSEFFIAEYARKKARIVPKGSILVTCIGSIGKIGITTKECSFNQQINAIIPNTELVDTSFLAHSLLYKKTSLQDLANSAVVPIINKSQFSEVEIRLPSLEAQKSIADRLDFLNSIISLRKTQLSKLDQLVKARFVEMFGGDFSRIKLGDVFHTTSGGTPSKSRPEYYENGTIPWLTSGEINRGVITSVNSYISELGLKNSSAKIIPSNSVVIAMYGATAGQVGLLKVETATNQAVCAILPHPQYVPEFLYYAISQKKDWMVQQSAGGAQPNISQAIIKRMELISPSHSLQEEFAAFVQKVDKTKAAVKQSLEKLETLKKSLMQEYFG